jgi:hypothetical protein
MRVVRVFIAVAAYLLATVALAQAQSWSWTYTSGIEGARDPASATLDLGPTRIKTTNRIAMIGRPDVVYGCTIELADVARALAVHTGTSSLLIQLKPDRKADCQLLGPTQSVVLRADNGALIDRIAGAINGSCCTAATAHPLTAAKHPAGPSKRIVSMPPVATTRAATRPADAPMMSVDDWVETDGVFAFVRIRNASNRPVLITDGEIGDCTEAEIGCGPVGKRLTILPFGVATLATIASTRQQAPKFTYRYTASMGSFWYAGTGSSEKATPAGAERLSQRDLRAAEAAMLAQFRPEQQGQPGQAQGTAPPARSPPQSRPHRLAQGPASKGPGRGEYVGPRLLRPGVSEPVPGKSGTIHIRVRLAPDGSPQDAAVISSTNDDIDDAAIEIAVSSTYAPARHAGHPVASDLILTISFVGGTPSIAGTTSPGMAAFTRSPNSR